MNLTDAVNVVIDGKTVDTISIDGEMVYQLLNIQLTSDIDHILTGETANITVNCERLPNKTLELFKVINMTRTSLGEKTTDSNGQATWTYTGDGSGNVTFIAEYDGKTSNTVVVDDYTQTVTSITMTGGGTYPAGTNVNAAATCKDQYGETMSAGTTVTFYDGGTVIGTADTNSSGVATFTTSSLTVGTHIISAFVGSVTSFITVVVTQPAFDGIDLLNTGTCILSQADGDTVTLEAQLMNGSSSASTSGIDVDFYDTAPATPVKLNSQSISTDSNGQARFTYTSQGSGDMEVIAYVSSMIQSETYSIQDCPFYDASSSSNISKYTIDSEASLTYDSTNGHYILSQSSNGELSVLSESVTVPTNYKLSADILHHGNANPQQWMFGISKSNGDFLLGLNIISASSPRIYETYNGNFTYQSGSGSTSRDTWYTFELTVNNGTATFKIIKVSDGTVVTTVTKSVNDITGSAQIRLINGNSSNASTYIKNIKIKPL